VKTPQVAGIILAAGKSRRMGRDKLLLPWQGIPVLGHVIKTAASAPLDPLVLVVDASRIFKPDQFELDSCQRVYCSGAVYSDSLRAGLAALEGDCAGAMFLLGDQPLVSTKTLIRLIRAFQADPGRWVAPVWRGRRGNPVIAPRSWFDRISGLEGDTGPRAFLADPQARLKLVEVDDEGVIFDIDCPGDYERLLDW
jgi:molybdenum cofactor cytidylyltransferase